MDTKLIAFVVLATSTGALALYGCGGSTSANPSGSTSATSSAAVTSGSGGAGGGGGAASASSGSAGVGGMGGMMGGSCTGAIDTVCKQCAATKCKDQAQKCADKSTCVSGMPTGGCLALVECAATKCGGADQICVLTMCGNELQSAGGPSGDGTAAALELGSCVQKNCSTECTAQGGGKP